MILELLAGQDNNLVQLGQVFSLGEGAFALVLFAISLLSYRKVRLTRLLLVSGAFALFALKSVVEHFDILFPQVYAETSLDFFVIFLDFVILLLIFLALAKR
jgi:hypothetical protein